VPGGGWKHLLQGHDAERHRRGAGESASLARFRRQPGQRSRSTRPAGWQLL